MTFISYAQNLEDVMLWRVLNNFRPGFYIDVGACDPVEGSVTKAFYDSGWNGINIEPMDAAFERVALDREKDINLKVAVGAQQGKITFYSVDEGGRLSTSVDALAIKYIKEGRKVDEVNVPVETLAHICEQYAEGEIHFLKITVEGNERCVLEGADFVKYRPWVILVESTEPNSTKPSYAAWEPILLDASYSFVYFDGLNRFYVANERMGTLAEGFSCPPNWSDCYQKNDYVKLSSDLEKIKNRLSEIEMNIDSIRKNFLPERPKAKPISEKTGELVGKNSSLAHLLQQKEEDLSSCKNRLDSLCEEISIYKARVDHELDACYQELYESSRHIGVLARDLNNAAHSMTERDATIITQKQHIQELERTVHDLYHSTSWRVSRPLRFLSRLITKAGLKK